jgi:glycosyltransferase involved in cell wall biosynthesis
LQKKNALFINYLIWKPMFENFRAKYDLLSKWYNGAMLHMSYGYQSSIANSFTFSSSPWSSNLVYRQLGYIFFCFRSAWRHNKLDYVISYDPTICGLIGLFIKYISGAKLIIEVNTDHLFSIQNNTKKSGIHRLSDLIKISLLHTTINRANGLKFVSYALYEKYRIFFKLKPDKPKHIAFYSYISTHVFRRTAEHKNYILFVGHPYDIKGVDVLIKAFNRISTAYPEMRLQIIGHCEDRTYYESLANYNPNITFSKGMEYNKIIKIFEECTFFVLPSRTEGIPRVLVEAMACGKAVIGSRVGGIPEVIVENKTGLLFESENDFELAQKMRLLLDDSIFRKQMGDAGYNRAKSLFSPQNYVETYHRFLESL